MKKLLVMLSFLIAAMGFFTFNVQATPIYGAISFSGTLTTDNASLDLATTLQSFSNAVVSTTGGTADYGPALMNQSVTLKSPFVFGPAPASESIVDFWELDILGKYYSYDILSSAIDFSGPNSLILSGTGKASITGFEDTMSKWFISATKADATSTFTFSALVPPEFVPPSAIPEPATMMLFGIGLLVVSAIGRKKE